MTTSIQFFGSPLAHSLLHALGWTLLHFCWQGTIVAAVLWCALQLLAGRSSQSRYVAACVAFLMLIAFPLLTFYRIAGAGLQSRITTMDSSFSIDPSTLLQISAGAAVAPWPARLAAAVDHRMPWLLALWLVGAIFFVVRLNYGLFIASRMKSSSIEPLAEDILQLFETLRCHLGINRAVRLLNSARVDAPTVIGWLRPVVLIPASCLTGLSTTQIEAIFCHELAHVRRNDYLLSVLQSIAESLLFYHPAVWWVSRQVRRERECCCDEIAVAHGGDVLAYARALAYLEQRRSAFPAFALGANGGVLSMRIKRLLGHQSDALPSQFAAFTLLALMIAVAGSYIATTARAQTNKTAPTVLKTAVASIARVSSTSPVIATPLHAIGLVQGQASGENSQVQSLTGVYETWLQQDAVYIITPPERAAYLRLKSDEERDKFIEQFWSRRDLPGLDPGSFRAQHYARIAYSNEHFAANKPGWMTDRGRIYITYGKPQSIDSHPSGGLATSPYEVWHYRTLADGKQSDVTFQWFGDNDYRIVLSNPGTAVTPAQPQSSLSVAHPGSSPIRLVAPTEYNGEPLRKIGPGVLSPVVMYQVEPKFSEQAREAKFNGIVLVNMIIDQNGQPQNVHVLRGVGMGLDESALEAVRQYKFRPAIENGQPVPVELNVEVNFRIFDGPKSQGQPSGTVPVAPAVARTKPDGTTMPVIVYQVEPEFSQAARKAKKVGTVLVHLTVDQSGKPEDVHVVRRLGYGLDQKAVDAVKQYRFRPATKDNQPIAAPLSIEVNFQIF